MSRDTGFYQWRRTFGKEYLRRTGLNMLANVNPLSVVGYFHAGLSPYDATTKEIKRYRLMEIEREERCPTSRNTRHSIPSKGSQKKPIRKVAQNANRKSSNG